ALTLREGASTLRELGPNPSEMTVRDRPIRQRPMTPATRAVAFLVAFAMAASTSLPARAQDIPRGIPIIRDAETEQLLRDYLQPILKAAGLAQQNIQVA